MRTNEKKKIEKFVTGADDSALAMAAFCVDDSGALTMEAQGNDKSIGYIYVAVYKMVRQQIKLGNITVEDD